MTMVAMRLHWRVRSVLASITDTTARFRSFWYSIAWVLAVVQVTIGGAYLLTGYHSIVASSAFTVFAHVFPGGVRLHGLILLVIGMTMTACLGVPALGHRDPARLIRRTLLASSLYALWTAALFGLAPLIPGGTFSFSAVVVWAAFALIGMFLYLRPPPGKNHRDETELIRAAVTLGFSPLQARALATKYFGGPDGEH